MKTFVSENKLLKLNSSGVVVKSPRWVALGYLKTAYSDDCINWIEKTSTLLSNMAYNGVFGNGKFIFLTSNQKLLISKNGIDWDVITIPSIDNYFKIAYGNNKFVLSPLQSNKVLFSENGIDWTEAILPVDLSLIVPSTNWNSFKFLNGKFVLCGLRNKILLYSEDGINWNQTTIPQIETDPHNVITYGNGKYVLFGNGTKIYHSSDLINWESFDVTIPSSLRIFGTRDLIFGDEKFIFVSNGSMIGYSYDGKNVTLVTVPESISQFRVSYGFGKFLLSGDLNKILYSSDGINWNSSSLIGEYWYNNIAGKI
jgi:hypothetical protein